MRIKNLGYKTAMWSLAYDDWDENKQEREEYGKNKIISNMHNGAIILLHANSKDNCNILDEQVFNSSLTFKTFISVFAKLKHSLGRIVFAETLLHFLSILRRELHPR